MSAEEIERKVAVIFATDVVSYSKHVEIDESNTLKICVPAKKYLWNYLLSIKVAYLILVATLF